MKFVSSLFLITLFLISCKKKVIENQSTTNQFENGLLVLNEGLFQQNNSSLSWIQFSTEEVNNSIFEQKTNRQLGDTGNDLKRYGSKIYIVVNVSSTIEVLDAKTGSSIAHIPMVEDLVPKQPRSIDFYGGKAYVSCFDGFVDVIDTATFTIQQRIPVGTNPEDILVVNNKIYVSNSGGLNVSVLDSTVSIINPVTNLEEQKIVIGKNPGTLEKDDLGNIYVIARGNYSSIPSRLVKINALNNTITSYSFDAADIVKMNSKFLILSNGNSTATVQLFNPTTGIIENSNFLDVSSITTLYKIQYDSVRDKIYCFDAMNYTNTGYIRVFSSNGIYSKSYHVGLNPSNALIYE